jgi:shikimate kinase
MDNLRLLLRQGILVYLREDLKTILERADKIGENRPLFSGLSHSELNHKIETMFLKREPFYRKAQVETLVNSGFSTIILATKLKLLTNRPQSL